jgi:outer membrane protein insertion porin family
VVAVVMLLAGTGGVARAAEDFSSQLKTVASIRFVGRHKVSAREIKAVLRMKPPSLWPWSGTTPYRLDFLSADTAAIHGVYRDHGYLDARVDNVRVIPSKDGRQVGIEYVIAEGRPSAIRVVHLAGVEHVPEKVLRRAIYARAGRPFNPGYLVVDTARVAAEYKDRGFNPVVTAEAEREHPDSLHVDVTYTATEGRPYKNGQTYLSSPGQVHVREHLIRRELLMRPGRLYRISKVDESQQHLYETGLFSQVQITTLPDSSNHLMEYDLRVLERKPRWVDAGAGSGSTERFRVLADWGHHNLLGRGLQAGVSGQLALDGTGKILRRRAETSLAEPWAFHTRTKGQVTVYYEDGRDVTDTSWVRPYDARGVSFSLRRSLALRTQLFLIQDNTYINQKFDLLKTDSLTLHRLDSLRFEVPPYYSTHRLTLGFDRDVRDNPINPFVGSTQSVAAEIAGGPLHGSTFLFDKFEGTGSVYRPSGSNGNVWAFRARAGLIRPFGRTAPSFTPDINVDPDVDRVPRDDRFRIGGVNSLRGYNENEIPSSGGLVLLLANAELRVPLIGPFGLEAYVDAGNVWARPEYMRAGQFVPKLSDEPLHGGDVRYVVGLGPRLNLPFGPLRLDFSWGLRPELNPNDPSRRVWHIAQPQFGIGSSF